MPQVFAYESVVFIPLWRPYDVSQLFPIDNKIYFLWWFDFHCFLIRYKNFDSLAHFWNDNLKEASDVYLGKFFGLSPIHTCVVFKKTNDFL